MSGLRKTLAEVAQLLGAELRGEESAEVTGLGTVHNARPGQVTFLANEKYTRHLPETKATAVLIRPELADQCPVNALLLDDPYLGFARLSHLFDPQPSPEAGIHPSASVSPSAHVASTAFIGAGVVVESEARIEDGARIGPGSVIGVRSHVGEGTVLAANVTLYHDVVLGQRCRISSGAVIGSDGFGYAHASDHWERIAQIGGVRIGNDVDVGANTSIDRGALDDTVIGDGVKIDNNVQIGHNVEIGEHSAMAALVGIAGSTHIGRHCIFGGASAIAGHLKIADHVHLTGMTMVTKNLNEPGVYSSGTGVESNRDWRRSVARFRQLDDMARRLRQLEKKLND
ncbi:UDP-3-O-[3-hydroxymyristoyl] glucosamine N-acyltransferase [Halospina denitrificans]|uniref:UDP-3-O-acylglucosamine N-acyltransferase n=1 Tax=Halospina denitrificans TaxID=332522 RepID=A0A4V3ERE9_9GAMM|nr:UDP-3-O-(3-hydroxymyristoyl)glucosamine N-acyltransferase [Halospina denitrificans]TDT43188.1 UDP-3-O-[3-hydroxymyristoyl] glucosamine N-acyltransferase [Halospina denitrificans]